MIAPLAPDFKAAYLHSLRAYASRVRKPGQGAPKFPDMVKFAARPRQ
jgi:hypothetical protein